MSSMGELVKRLVSAGVLKHKSYIDAFLAIDRKLFIWPGYESDAYMDQPSPLGSTGQTISAPHIHAYYLEYTMPSKDSIVLEVGAGSGYLAALMGFVIKNEGGSGHVYAIEYLPQLHEFATRNIREVELEDHVTVIFGNGYYGWPPKIDKEIYDVIWVSAGASRPPKYLLKQLKRGGRLLIPLGNGFFQQLTLYTKDDSGAISKYPLFSVAFVPMRGARDEENNF